LPLKPAYSRLGHTVFEVVLPKAPDRETQLAQPTPIRPVPAKVPRKLGQPVLLIAFGEMAMAWTTVIEAPIKENDDAQRRDYDIRPAWHGVHIPVNSPAVAKHLANCSIKTLLRFASSAADTRHDLAPLLAAVHIGHASTLC
jgi:hypothetical protein